MSNVDKSDGRGGSCKKQDRKLTGKHLANKVLANIRMTESRRRVAAQLIDHMHGANGPCFPGMRRLAYVTEHSLPTVRSAIAFLTDPSDPNRLFDNLNRGQGKRPNYRPRWERFKALDAELDARSRRPSVQDAANSSNRLTVSPPFHSDCEPSGTATVQNLPNKTNLRTKGARPAAPQAARPARAPSHIADKNVVEAVQVRRDTALDAFPNEIPVPSYSFDQKTEGVEPASPGSPSRLDGGSPAPPSETMHQSLSQPPASRGPEEGAPPVALPGRKPVLPPINDPALYNRLTKRSRR